MQFLLYVFKISVLFFKHLNKSSLQVNIGINKEEEYLKKQPFQQTKRKFNNRIKSFLSHQLMSEMKHIRSPLIRHSKTKECQLHRALKKFQL